MRTTGPTRTVASAARLKVLAWQRRNASVTGFAIALRNAASSSVNEVPPPPLQRSRKPQQPYRQRKTSDATSVTPNCDSMSRQMRLRSSWPPVDSRSSATGVSIRVQRLIGVRYFRRIRRGSSGRHGTSARGAEPTSVSGSVSNHAWASKPTTGRISASTATRSESASEVVDKQSLAIRSIPRDCALIAAIDRWYAQQLVRSSSSKIP
jgi:hypothetical protein